MKKLINQIDIIRNSNPEDQIITMHYPVQWTVFIEGNQYPIVETVYNSLKSQEGNKIITRNDIVKTINEQERIVKAMMWAFPNEIKYTPVLVVLSELQHIVSHINKFGNDFVRLYGKIIEINGISDSTASIILYASRLILNGKRALAITSHTLNAYKIFEELSDYCKLTYIPQLLALYQEAERIGVDAEQLEYYLFRVSSENIKII